MKTTRTILLTLLLFFTANLFAQSWTWQNPYPNANSLRTSYFFDQSTGFYGGESGNLLKTTNGGANISIINTGNNYNNNAITFINSTTGYIGGGTNEKIIMKTINGGANWTVTNLGTPYSIKDIKFINANTGLAITTYQTVYITTNGGSNWTSSNSDAQVLNSINYLSPTLAYVSSSGGVLQKTTNGGVNWTSQVIATVSTSLYSVQFPDSLTGYVCGDYGTVVKTTNGGANWTNVNSPVNTTIYSLSFINATTGIAACEGGYFLKTTNGGTNWVAQMPYPANGFALNAAKYFASGVIYLSGTYGNNMKSSDAGSTWLNLVAGRNTDIFSSYFINASTGFASTYAGYILKTTNGGTNWTEYLTPTSGNNITGLQFIDANTGYAIPSSGYDQILKTTNAGTNWFLTVPGINNTVQYLNFQNANTGILITSFSTYRTTNGGTNWAFIDSVNYTLNGLQFGNASTGYTTYYNSPNTYFRKTTNGGLNWASLPAPLTNTYVTVFKFLNGNTGYATAGGNMYKTTNGGNNWTQSGSTGITVQSIQLIDSTAILLGSVFGDIKKSTDGGVSFTSIPFVSQNSIYTMSFTNSMTGWIMGAGGMIVKTNDLLTGNGVIDNQTPKNFNLSQNYPNPFNPTTRISYALSKSGIVTLRVYDILGREAAILVNEYKNAGNYTVDFTASSYTSGIYFYKLEVNGMSEVKKMILLK